uniref:Glutaminyl-peptide cyclotransferase n=1 Tax=Crassostrea virginica TaxID=6565 RepID=A0A8B8DXB1_CRAVI|nr:glutaminyl-peptide cyclotransferase-like [Crassostrea virginica]XP_022332144.1 glutaminyl-peptide cyclotransferase-like [Crassostrea virginica]
MKGVKGIVLLLCAACAIAKSKSDRARSARWISGKALRTIVEDYSDLADFKNLLKPILIPRMPDTPGNTQVRNYLISKLRALNWHVEEDVFQDDTPYGRKTFVNIIATQDPRKPKKMVLAAHYDSKNLTDRNGREFIGATDSAVPCAILLDMATQLNCLFEKAQGEKARDITPQIVFFDGEEAYQTWTETDSIYGARHLAAKWQQEDVLKDIEIFVLLDLIGTNDVQFHNFFSQTSNAFELLAKKEQHLRKERLLSNNNRILFNIHQSYGGGIEDDHIPFLHRSVPILHLISAPFPSVWHRMSDDAAHIDYHTTQDFNKIFRVFVASYLHLDALHNQCRRKKEEL